MATGPDPNNPSPFNDPASPFLDSPHYDPSAIVWEKQPPTSAHDIRHFGGSLTVDKSPAKALKQPIPAERIVSAEDRQEAFEANAIAEQPADIVRNLDDAFKGDAIVLEDGAHSEQQLNAAPLISGTAKGPGGARIPGPIPDPGLDVAFTNESRLYEIALLRKCYLDRGTLKGADNIKKEYGTPGPPEILRHVVNSVGHDVYCVKRPNNKLEIETHIGGYYGPIVPLAPQFSHPDPATNPLFDPSFQNRSGRNGVRKAVWMRRQQRREYFMRPDLPEHEKVQRWQMRHIWNFITDLPGIGSIFPPQKPRESNRDFNDRRRDWRSMIKNEVNKYEVDGHPNDYASYNDLFSDYQDRYERQLSENPITPRERRQGEYMAYMAREHQVTIEQTGRIFNSIVTYSDQTDDGVLRIDEAALREHSISSDVRILVRADLLDDLKEGKITRRDMNVAQHWPNLPYGKENEFVDRYGNRIDRDYHHGHEGQRVINVVYGSDNQDQTWSNGAPPEVRAFALTNKPIILICRQTKLLQSQKILEELGPHNACPKFTYPCDVYHISGTPGCGKSTVLESWLKHNLVDAVAVHKQKLSAEQKAWNQRKKEIGLAATGNYVKQQKKWMEDLKKTKEEFLEAFGTIEDYEDAWIEKQLRGVAPPRESEVIKPYLRCLIIVPTRAARAELVEVVSRLGLDKKFVKVCTIDSAMLNDWGLFDNVFIDEKCMAHAAILDIVRNMTNCRRAYLLGDMEQIGFVNRVPRFELKHALHQPYIAELLSPNATPKQRREFTGFIFHEKQFMPKTYRCPEDVSRFFEGWHEGLMVSDDSCSKEPSLFAYYIGDDNKEAELPDRLNAPINEEHWMTFTQAEKFQQWERGERLNNEDRQQLERMPPPPRPPGRRPVAASSASDVPEDPSPSSPPPFQNPQNPNPLPLITNREFRRHTSTCHERQGATYEDTNIIRTNANPQAAIFRSNQHRMTAFTRHRRRCVYYTVVRDDIYWAIVRKQPLKKLPIANEFEAKAREAYFKAWADAKSGGYLLPNPGFPPGDAIKFDDLQAATIKQAQDEKASA